MDSPEGLQLLSVSGMTESDCTQIYQLIDQSQLALIDLHQGSVYDRHSLNILLDVRSEQVSWWQKQLALLKTYAESKQISLTLSSVSDASYQRWLSGRGKPHYIMTILSEGLSPKFLSVVGSVLRKYQMSIETVQRLSGYGGNPVRRIEQKVSGLFVVEFMLRGNCEEEDQLRMEILSVGEQLGVNIGIQRDTIYRRHRRLFVMDMDSTLIETEVIDELALAKGPDTAHAVSQLTQRAMDGELNFNQSLKKRVQLLKGIPQQTLNRVAQKLPLRKGALTLCRELRKLGYKTAIISGGFDFCANVLQKQLNIDRVYANSLELRDGALTGALVGKIVDSKAKLMHLKHLVKEMGINIEQSVAVGDGANDIEMVSKAGLGIAYHSGRAALTRHASHTFGHIHLDSILYLIGLRSYAVST